MQFKKRKEIGNSIENSKKKKKTRNLVITLSISFFFLNENDKNKFLMSKSYVHYSIFLSYYLKRGKKSKSSLNCTNILPKVPQYLIM